MKKCAQIIWAIFFRKKMLPTPKNIGQTAKFRPIRSHCSFKPVAGLLTSVKWQSNKNATQVDGIRRKKPPHTLNDFYLLHFFLSAELFTFGVNVMITIFCDFLEFSAKNLAFFEKKQCYDQIFA
jgi:hypothetical protein